MVVFFFVECEVEGLDVEYFEFNQVDVYGVCVWGKIDEFLDFGGVEVRDIGYWVYLGEVGKEGISGKIVFVGDFDYCVCFLCGIF